MTQSFSLCQRTLFTRRFQPTLSLFSVYTNIPCRKQHQLSVAQPIASITTLGTQTTIDTIAIATTATATASNNTFQWGDMVLLRETRKGKRSLIGPLKPDGRLYIYYVVCNYMMMLI
jgi:hypothetical protein